MTGAAESQSQTAGAIPSPVARAIRRRIAAQQIARGVAPPAPPPPDVVPRRAVRTPAQVLATDGTSVAAVLLITLGLATLVLGWRGVAATLDVQVQTAFLVSGGLAGLTMVGFGCGLVTIQGERFAEAQENNQWRALARRWNELSAAVETFHAHLPDARGEDRP